MTANAQQETVLVTAATGKTGRRVVARLQARGVPVRAGSRTPGAGGGEVVFDWDSAATWGPALVGVDSAYVAFYPDLAAPGAVEAMSGFGRVAAEQGVRHLVLLSGRGEPDAVVSEEALRASGVPLTVVRAAFFAQNFSEGVLADLVAGGAIAFPGAQTPEPFIDADDIADVVVAALTEGGHRGKVHEVTGPRLVTFGEAAAELGSALGREVRYLPVSGPEFAALLQQAGFPEPDAQWLAALCTMLMDGHNASTTNAVREVLGRDPKDFKDFARDAVAADAWHS
ncbi:NmrA family NAD(P)-binding protein [Streptomyces albipurpureus]|uniref:NAD(P)H-binding protein n=1 Tax=Streptomyces albipurpureus TaxID=2897419 RepID=A0ABT0UEG4_9ACTN|nr:NAD(P)H-binding protein [Streptomyces sp. CWNU-1]MCM2386907.1 NAD(P)H-binding protein [Streptomyces sp. CWNU-1]